MSQTIFDLASGVSYVRAVAKEETVTAEEHEHTDVHADEDHVHAPITSFDVATGLATTLAVGTLNVTDLEVIGAAIARLAVSDHIGATIVNATTANIDTLNVTDIEATGASIADLTVSDQIGTSIVNATTANFDTIMVQCGHAHCKNWAQPLLQGRPV